MASAAQRNIRSVSYAKYGYIFILPFFLVYCFFQLWPLINTFILSVYGNGASEINGAATGTGLEDFVGLGNFETLLFGGGSADREVSQTSDSFFRTFINTLIIWGGNFLPQIGLSLLLAVWFTDAKLKVPGKGFFKVIMYMPNIITAASVAVLFVKLFSNSADGVVNSILMDIPVGEKTSVVSYVGSGLKSEEIVTRYLVENPIQFVNDKWIGRVMIMFIQAWMWFGNTMIMLMSGIMGLNPSLFEAANIDGASSGQVFRKITFPLLKPILLYTLITSMIGGLQMFDIPLLFREGKASRENLYTKTIAVFIYEKFTTSVGSKPGLYSYGYSAAASVLLFFVTIALGALTFYINRDKEAAAFKKERRAKAKALKAQQKQSGLGGMEI